MRHRSLSRLATALVGLTAATGVLSASADAEAVEPHPIGRTSLTVSPTTGGFDVCYSGSAWDDRRVAGAWEVVIGGTSTTIPAVVTGTGPSISGCRFFSTSILPGGQIAATFTYVGVGLSTGTSLTAGSVGGGTWAPLIAPLGYAVDINK